MVPCTWKAQSEQYFFMTSKFKVSQLHKNYICSSTKPGNWKPGMGNFLLLVYYNFMENQVTILTMYCVNEIEKNYF